MHNRHFPGAILGFSLVQISVILVIAAIIIASLLPGGVAGDYNKKIALNIAKLDKVETAMTAFMTQYGRRPCPADGRYDMYDHYFGVEAANPGTCTGGVISAPLGPDSSTFVVAGTIPTKTLNLPDEYALDAFGRQFMYEVDVRATSAKACYALENPGGVGGIFVNNNVTKSSDGKDTIISTDNTMYAYISYGSDGTGAFPAAGSDKYYRMFTYTMDPDSLNNAGIDPINPYDTYDNPNHININFTNTLIKKPPTTNNAPITAFDNLVYYHKDDMNTCCIGNGCSVSNPGGFIVQGAPGSTSLAGLSVAVGDINGDGIDDLIIGAPLGASQAGAVYVVFGTRSVFSGTLSLGSLNGSNGFEIDGINSGDLNLTGASVAVGDINGDGIKDIIIGAPGLSNPTYATEDGAVYVVFGGPAQGTAGNWLPSGSVMSLSNLNGSTGVNGTNGFVINGVAQTTELAGWSVAAGDINGDGIDDVIIGAIGAGGGNGGAYVVFGKTGVWPATFNLASADGTTSLLVGTNGFAIYGVTSGDLAGYSVASGDINGDGIDDVIIGAPNAGSSNAGAAYVVLGSAGSWSTTTANPTMLANLTGSGHSCPSGTQNGTCGFVANGDQGGDLAGTSVAAGDINGDSIADLIVGAPNSSVSGNGGSVYVVYGQNATMANWPASINLSGLTAPAYPYYPYTMSPPTGFRWDDLVSGDATGTAVASGCSVNGSGVANLLAGAPATPNNGAGNTNFVVFGSHSNWSNTQNFSALSGTNGVTVPYINANDGLVYSFGLPLAAGDINGVGKCALIIGAAGYNNADGGVFVVLGQSKWGATYNLGTLR